METIQYNLPQDRIPRAWYNILADLPTPMAPPLHPGTLKPIGPDDLAPLFPMALIMQEVSTEREIEIPDPVRQVYAQWRPTPLFRARRLEKALDTPAKIYYKYEGVSPAGSHKPNTAVAQAYYNKVEGTKRLATETGAGQWGSSLAMACAFFGMECKVYMVRVSYNQKPYRRALMEAFGASVTASPSTETESGRAILAEHPDSPGSLGIAISEAVEVAAKDPNTKYALGSVLNHVLLHQTVIGLEAIEQMAMAGDEPDVIVGCTGGGSNFAGLVMPYLGRKLKGQSARAHRGGGAGGVSQPDQGAVRLRLRRHRPPDAAGEDAHAGLHVHSAGHSCGRPALSRHGAAGFARAGTGADRGHRACSSSTHLRPASSLRARKASFPRRRPITPWPERSAKRCRRRKRARSRTILFNLCGHGHFDMQSYIDYQAGKLENYEYPAEEIAMALAGLPAVR